MLATAMLPSEDETSRQPRISEVSSTQQHLVLEIYRQMSHQEHFFLEYVPAVFTSQKSTVMQLTVQEKL